MLSAYPKTQILAGATLQRRACQNLSFLVHPNFVSGADVTRAARKTGSGNL